MLNPKNFLRQVVNIFFLMGLHSLIPLAVLLVRIEQLNAETAAGNKEEKQSFRSLQMTAENELERKNIIANNCLLPRGDEELPASSLFKDGSYYGMLNIDDQKISMYARLDIAATSFLQGVWKSRAVLRVSAGHWHSDEFVATYIPEIAQSQDQTVLNVINSPQSPMALENLSLRGAVLRGELKEKGMLLGGVEIFLETVTSKQDDQNILELAKYPIVTAVEGSYKGVCSDQKASEMILHLSRWPRSQAMRGLFEDIYKVDGEISKNYSESADESLQLIRSSSWNPLLKTLSLNILGGKSLGCRLENEEIICAECKYKKKEAQTPYGFPKNIQVPVPIIPGLQTRNICAPSLRLQGEYFGYLYHREQGIYQISRLKLGVSPKGDESDQEEKGEFVANFFMGNPKVSPHLVQKMSGMLPYIAEDLVFETAKNEFFFVLMQANDNLIWGAWYGKSFGYIGDVLYAKDQLWKSKKVTSKNFLRGLQGSWPLPQGYLDLTTSSSLSREVGDVAPIEIHGTFTGLEKKYAMIIKSGVFDFLTGNFILRGQKNEKIIYGHFSPGNGLSGVMSGFFHDPKAQQDPHFSTFYHVFPQKTLEKPQARK